jgi:hypothetical protein
MKNDFYKNLRDFVNEHHGFSPKDFIDHPEIREGYDKFMNFLKSLKDKRVKISFTNENDFVSSGGTKIGRIGEYENRVIFFEGKKRTRFYYLDAGLFEGWYATLIVHNIEVLN